jgi:thiamine-monophosphate kinase
VDSLTEDALIAALRAIVEAPADGATAAPRGLVVGIGDDAAAWQPSRSHLSVITTDTLVDGVHFLSDSISARHVGHRAMASNLSDIAAMGARPVLATVALGVAPGTSEEWILECYRGMQALASAHATRIAGGDIVRAPALTLSISIVGEVSRSRLRRRDRGRAGDVLGLTGPLGASHAGLVLGRRSLELEPKMRDAAIRAYETPEPRLREGRWLAASANVHAMMDCSDGLSTDVSRLAAASGLGATIVTVPIHAAAHAVAVAAGEDARTYALDGGEDFELIVAVAPRAFAHLARRFVRKFGRPLVAIGTLDRTPGLRLHEASQPQRELVPAGWDHLRESG